ncbi:MAG: terminase family protein, partial [Pseudomonadota bacterium]
MPHLWDLWAHPEHQTAPEGDWTTWVILGGRGAGKTRAGAEWVRSRVEGPTPDAPGLCRRMALVGETVDEARAVMVEGESGLLACSPPDRRPEFIATRGLLRWPNGAEARLVSAFNYESLRGPQFDGAWSDELAKWRYGQEAWDMLQFTLRLGDDPRQIVTTTPRDVPALRRILDACGTVVSHAGTDANAANLAPGFIDRLRERYAGTRLGRQELDGVLVEGREGALWHRDLIDSNRAAAPDDLTRIVVGIDPPVTSRIHSDECGIIVAGLRAAGPRLEWQAWILGDRSTQGTPQHWAETAVRAYEEFRADRLVAEVNQGGEMIEALLRQIDDTLAFSAVYATTSKRTRAEPISALYEQGRVHHAEVFDKLEAQMC